MRFSISFPDVRPKVADLFFILKLGVLLPLFACQAPWHDAQEAVRQQMKDPDATQFRNLRFCGDGRGAPEGVITGEYNGKNSYGAYEGYKTFYWAGGLPVFDYDTDTPIFKRCMAEMARHTAKIRADTQAMIKAQSR